MPTLTLAEVRHDPKKITKLLQSGKTVRVTKRGRPLFDAVPIKEDSTLDALFSRTDAALKDKSDYSTKDIVQSLRDSRE